MRRLLQMVALSLVLAQSALADAGPAKGFFETPCDLSQMQGLGFEDQLDALLKEYFSAYARGGADAELDASTCGDAIAELMLGSAVDPQAYDRALEVIDLATLDAPHAVFDLAYTLQTEWERLHLVDYVSSAENAVLFKNVSAKAGLLTGLFSILSQGVKSVAPQYFALHSFLTLAGYYGAGYGAGATLAVVINKFGRVIPTPPASRLRTAMKSGRVLMAEELGEKKARDALVGFTAVLGGTVTGIATFGAAQSVQSYRLASFLAKYGKFSGGFLSLAVTWGGEEFGELLVGELDISRLRRTLTQRLNEFSENSSRAEHLMRASRLVRATLLLGTAYELDAISMKESWSRRQLHRLQPENRSTVQLYSRVAEILSTEKDTHLALYVRRILNPMIVRARAQATMGGLQP